LINFRKYSKPVPTNTLNPLDKNNSVGEGSLVLLLQHKTKYTVICVREVQFVPTADKTLISAAAFNAQFRTTFELNMKSGSIFYRTKKQMITTLIQEGRLYKFQARITRKKQYCEYFSKSCLSKTVAVNCNFVCMDSFSFCDPVQSSLTCLRKSDNTPIVPQLLACNLTSIKKRPKSRKKLTPKQKDKLLALGKLWHDRLGHISAPYLNRLKTVAQGVDDFIFPHTQPTCEPCVLAKMTRKSYNQERTPASRIGEIVHADLIGEISPISSFKQKRYLLTTVDDYSRYMHVAPLKSKTETPESLDKILREIQTRNPGLGQMDKLYCDRGSEFISKQTEDVLAKYGMVPQFAERGCHEHNGTAERANLTIEQRTCAILASSGLPSRLWNFAAQAACYLYNQSPHSSLGFVTPYEMYYGHQPDLSNIRRYGSWVYVHNDKLPRSHKLAPRATREYLVGYTPTGYITIDPAQSKPHYVCDTVIDEAHVYKDEVDVMTIPDDPLLFPEPTPLESFENISSTTPVSNFPKSKLDNLSTREGVIPQPLSEALDQTQSQDSVITVEIDDEWDSEVYTDEPPAPPIEVNSISFSLDNNACLFDSYGSYNNKDLHTFQNLPLSYELAKNGSDALEWAEPIKKELDAIAFHNVWKIVPRTPDMKIIPAKWVFSIKENGKRKARLVAVGCRDPEASLYTADEKASPTPSASVIRWVFSLAVHNGWGITQHDFTNAFLHSFLDRVKYMMIPPGLSYDSKKFVCKLNKALYGLATAPLCWYKLLSKTLENLGFEMSPRELCVFRKTNSSDPKLIQVLLAYVDDIIITGNDTEGIKSTLNHLESKFQIRNLGFPSKFVGLQIEKLPDNSLFIHQYDYLKKIAKIYRLDTASPVPTPMVPVQNHKLVKSDSDPTFPFKQALGHVQYAANYSRPDISYSVGYLARYQSNPQPLHWAMIKRLLQYLNCTANFGLLFSKNTVADQLYAFADADNAAEKERRSTTGYLIYSYGNVISWCSRLQRGVSSSSQEAEYRAINEATFELLFLARLTQELIEPVSFPITIREDNLSTISQCSQYANKGRIKHVELPYFLIRQNVKRGHIRVLQIDSASNLADLFTKTVTTVCV
jgi:transposase InsO family protein